MRRFVQDTPHGPILVQMPAGAQGSVISVGMAEQVELDVTDAEWANIHKQVKTDVLDFATVKKQHGITKEPK